MSTPARNQTTNLTMRLTEQQVTNIITALNAFLYNSKAKLYLYGSRIHDYLKGGDIDLLLVTANENDANTLLDQKHILLAQIKKLIGEQKIDLKIAAEFEIITDAFLKSIMPSAILLNHWP